ncbi:MAG: hypothetical protein HDR21_10050 [Lachnospiraceae bacterium]|nr:hypothetical protein [Lachnospiraceae bacterium]MBD5483359.1 hypothetical protein [Lachnospiraceae bacterium]
MRPRRRKQAFVVGDTPGLQEVGLSDKIDFMDITNEWTKCAGIKGSVIERQEYAVNGTTYKVDGKYVEFVPQIMVPQGVQTPDYLIDGERFDLKSPTGRSKDLFYNVVSKKRKQASSFIFSVTDCPLSDDEIRKQIEALYFSRHTRFIDKIVIMKNKEIQKVYGRK